MSSTNLPGRLAVSAAAVTVIGFAALSADRPGWGYPVFAAAVGLLSTAALAYTLRNRRVVAHDADIAAISAGQRRGSAPPAEATRRQQAISPR